MNKIPVLCSSWLHVLQEGQEELEICSYALFKKMCMRDILRKKDKTDIPKATKWGRHNVSIAPDYCFQL